jgi:hypothetical protein
MAISKPAGRPGPPVNPIDPPKAKSRSGSAYEGSARSGFSLNGGSTIDAPAVKPSSPVQPGTESLPSTELGEKAV